MATKKTTTTTTKITTSTPRETIGVKDGISFFVGGQGGSTKSSGTATSPTPTAPTAPKSSPASGGGNPTGSVSSSNPQTFGFMDGSTYDASGNQIKPPRYTAPVAPVATPATMKNGAMTAPVYSNSAPQIQTVNEQKIRNETRARMQSSIDAINANYASLMATENRAGQDRLGQNRALNARSGLMGSDFGNANTASAQAYNKEQQQAIIAQQNTQLAAVYDQIEQRAQAEIAARKQDAENQYTRETAMWKEMQDQARNDMKTLADKGVDINSLSPAQKQALFKQAGLDSQFGELVYNAMKPKPQQIDYKFEKLADGRGLFYGVDPVTGQLKTQNVSVDLPADWSMTIAPDGTVIGFDKNSGSAQVLSDKGAFRSPLEAAQIDKIYNDIANGGGDGMLSVDEANKLGVPYGTTKTQAAGIIPGSAEKVQAAETSMNFVDEIIRLTNELENHKGLSGATGMNRLLTAVPGSNARDFVAKFDELKGVLSLDNIKYLKGTGAISDAEQQLLSNAAGALRRDTSTSQIVSELQRLRDNATTYKGKLQNIINSGSQSTIQEFESQYGGSSGTNPKAPSTTNTTSLRSVNTKTLASAVLPKYPQGSTGGQCVTFLHQIASFPSVGDGKLEKFATVDKLASQGKAIKGNLAGNAKVGMILITGENKTYGHGAMINAVSSDGQYARLTESNYGLNGKVTHTRVIALNNPKIYGAIIPNKINSLA